MLRKHYYKQVEWIERHRFQLLLLATILVLILPAVSGKAFLTSLLFVTCMSFLFIQSMIVATTKKSKRIGLRYFIVAGMIIISWLDPAGLKSQVLDVVRLLLLALFFVFITYYLVRFMRKASSVDINVVFVAINIYLLIGIIFGSLAFLFYNILPGAYNFPATISKPNFITFNYYSFITMSTVGYGDITPGLAQTQTLAYLIAVTGQLYVAIIIAFLVGKLLMYQPEDKK